MAQYGSSINEVIAAGTDPVYEGERVILVNQARLYWEFVKGFHFSVPGQVATPYGDMTSWVPFVQQPGGEAENGADIKLCPPINVIGGDCFKFMAVMGQNAPKVKAVADDAQDRSSLDVARNADVQARDLWVKNKIDRRWKTLAFHQYVTGPCFLRGIWNVDAKKYGQSTEPEYDVQDTPDGPVPVKKGEQTYPNGDAEMEIYSVLEVAIPYESCTLEECYKLTCEKMRSKWALLAKYKGKDGKAGPLEQYRTGDPPDDNATAAQTSADEAREAVSAPSGIGQQRKQNQWRHTEHWLQPHLFEAISNPEARKIFQEQFPNGLYVAKVGSINVEVDNRDVCDEWAVCRVGRSEKIMERPIAADALPIQRALNDLNGMAIETVLRAITQTIMDAQLIDRESYSTKEAIPSEIILTTLPVDGDLSKRIYQIPPARLSDQVLPLFDRLRALMQDITGIRPELSGGGEPTQTYREAKQRRDQALLQLAPQANELRYASEQIGTILIKLRAKYGAGTVKAQKKSAYGIQTDMADIAQLKDTGWHLEADDNFPMTTSDSRDAMFSLLKEFPPEIQTFLGIMDAMNIEEIFELLQIPGFESPILDQVRKTLARIEQLNAPGAVPIPGQPGPDGKPGAPQPSIPPDAFDNHAVVTGIVQKWLVARFEEENSNPQGYQNVVAYFNASQALAVPPPPPPVPPVKASLSWSAKLEDFPSLTSEVLEGAGMSAPPPNAVDQASAALAANQQPAASGPGSNQPLPPLPNQLQGPGPLPVQ